MTRYLYRCAGHGVREIVKPMAEAGRPEPCGACGVPMARVWTVPAMIMRPGGYNLKPGDRGYAHFRREVELGEIDAHRPLVAEGEADPYVPDPALVPEPSEDAKQALGEWAQANLS